MGNYCRLFAAFSSVVLFAFYSGTQSTNISYDGRALKIDGQRRLIISGSIHYPRSTPEMWPSLIQKAKDGGLNAIETYVFWNAHEPIRRQYDFSGNLDLVKYLKLIQNAGLYAILRIGPYVCAEWNYGGFPMWLHNLKSNITFRTTNEIFMSEMEAFTTLIVNMMKAEKLFASDGGPIILAQIENEFGNVEGPYGSDGPVYVNECVSFAEGLKIGIPWIMCQQYDAPDPIIYTCNGYYCDQFWPKNTNIPKMWTENWTGWFKKWGDSDPHRTAEDVAFAVARFYQLRGTLQNYYMYHGGTNFGRTSGGPYIVTSYDYDAPLNEYGLKNQPKWGHLKELHEIILSLENILTYGDFTDHDYGNMMFSTVFSLNGTRVCFFGNANEQENINITFEGKQITTPSWSVSIYRDCKTEVFNTARISVKTTVMEKVNHQGGLQWKWRAEQFERIKNRHDKQLTFAPQLLDQKSVTNDTSDYLWYMTNVDINKDDPIWGREATLQVHTTGHILHAFLNNKHTGSQWAKDGHFDFVLEETGKIKHGKNTISLLSGSVGLPNYGAFFEKSNLGVLGPVKLVAPNGEEMDLSQNRWGYKVGINGIDVEKLYSDKKKRNWHHDLQFNRPLVWYKAFFDTPPGDAPVVLDLEHMGKGTAWVNGFNIGRYWPSFFASDNGCNPCDYRGAYHPEKCRTNCGKPSQKWYHVPRDFLKKNGENNLVLFEELGGNPEKVGIYSVKAV